MELSAEPIIYGLIFVGVLVLVEGLYLVAFGKSISLNSRVNRRLEMLDKGGNREQVLEQLRKEMQQHMKTQSIPLYSLLAEKAQKAAIAFTHRQLIMNYGRLGGVGLCWSNHRDRYPIATAHHGVGYHWRRCGVFVGQ